MPTLYTLHRRPYCAGCARIKTLTAVAEGDMATCHLDGKVWIRRVRSIGYPEVVRTWEPATWRARRSLRRADA